MKKRITVVGAVVIKEGRVLCAQRRSGALAGMWEFPGGKVEPGETLRAALEREVDEELGMRVHVGEPVTTTTYEYDFGVVTLATFYCDLLSGVPRLADHSAVEWRAPTDLHELHWAPADRPSVLAITTAHGSEFRSADEHDRT